MVPLRTAVSSKMMNYRKDQNRCSTLKMGGETGDGLACRCPAQKSEGHAQITYLFLRSYADNVPVTKNSLQRFGLLPRQAALRTPHRIGSVPQRFRSRPPSA